MTIVAQREDGKTVLKVDGRIDTNTSPQLQSAILKEFQTHRNVVIDFENVPYISSAGLRALLIGQKTAASKGGEFALKNVSGVVQSVLESVGFSKVLKIIP